MFPPCIYYHTPIAITRWPTHLNLESKPFHATSVLINRASAVLRRVGRIGEKHAFVSTGLFVFAYAARLSTRQHGKSVVEASDSLGAGRTFGFSTASEIWGVAVEPREAGWQYL